MLKKFSKVSFALLSLSLIFSSFIPSLLSAQTVTESTVPLVIKINSTAYSASDREVILSFNVTNNSGSFVDNLRYNFEFYNGEKLEKDGLLFRNLQYVFSTSDPLEKLAPNESRNHTIKYKVPETIPGGNYFLRGTVYNEELSFYGITHTKDPLKLTGRGTFVTNKTGRLVDVENKKVYPLMEGPTLEKDKTYLVAYVRSANEQLFELIDENAVFSDIKISHITDNEDVVYEKKDMPLQSLLREDDLGIEFKIEPWENIKSGSHTAFITFKNAQGEQIAESAAVRLLYRGLLGRITTVDTNINSYRGGDPVNLVINTVVAGDEKATRAFATAFLKSSGEIVQEITKEITLNQTFEGTKSAVDFTDVNIKSKAVVDEIEVILKSESGEVLDTQTVQMDPTKVFEYPRDSSWIKNILISIVLLIAAVIILAYVKKKTNLTVVSILLTALLISSSIIFSNMGMVYAQYGDSNDVCYDMNAINYGSYGQCEYMGDPTCQDYTANNYGANGVCTYDDPVGGGCTDPSANNYDGTAIYDNGSCTYDETPGCTNPDASNYNPEASVDDGSCEEIKGCMDWTKRNYNPKATVDDGSCSSLPPLYRELLNVWIDDGTQLQDGEICTVGCTEIEFYVKVQCEACLNGAENITVNYNNNISGGSSIYDRIWSFDSDGGGEVDVQYNMYTVGLDEELIKQSENLAYSTELKVAEENNLAGYPVYANDITNEWIYGPFVVSFCPDNVDENGNMIPEMSQNGEYVQSFRINVDTSFNADFCKADLGISTITREISCSLPGELRSSFYLDDNEDGLRDDDEVYLRSSDGDEACSGVTGAPFGLIRNITTQEAFGELDSIGCDDSVPYFFKNLLDPGDYEVGIDTDNSFGLIKTGVEYFVDSVWSSDDFITIGSDGISKSRIGIKVEHQGGVAISCVADPRYTEEVAPAVTWGIKSFISDNYNIEDLIFVWQGIGEMPENPTERLGTNNGGAYSITYPKSNGTETHNISVFAKRASDGVIVSNTANCRMYVSPFLASCAAYTSITDSVPDTAFDVGQQVFWRSSVENGNAPFTYEWSGIGDSSGNANPVTTFSSLYEGDEVEAELTVTDSRGYERTTMCPAIFIKECGVGDPCAEGFNCNELGMCVLPPPDFSRELTLNPSVVNVGGTCGLSWTVDEATTCVLKRNNEIVPIDEGDEPIGTSGNIQVEPGTYTMECVNEDDPNENRVIAQSGPVRCLVNPNIREQ